VLGLHIFRATWDTPLWQQVDLRGRALSASHNCTAAGSGDLRRHKFGRGGISRGGIKLVSDLAAWTPLSTRILEVDQPACTASVIERKLVHHSSGTGEICEFLWLKRRNEEQRLANKEQAFRPPLAGLHKKSSDLIIMQYFRGLG